MSRSTITLIALLAMLAGLLGYNYFAKPFNQQSEIDLASTLKPTPAAAPQSWQYLDELSPEQRVAMVLAAPLTIEADQPNQQQLVWIRDNYPGMVTLFGDKVSTSAAQKAISALSENNPNKILLAVDHEGGTVQRLNGTGFTVLPSWQRLCAESSSDRQTILLESANELQALGIDVVFGPVLDLAASGSALRARTCSSDPEQVVESSAEYVKIFTSQKILPVIKHFPGIGSATVDLHNAAATIAADENAVAVFQQVLNQYPKIGVMMAHISLQGGLNGEVCSLSSECVKGFKNIFEDALVFSDALEMKSAAIDPQASGSATRSLTDRAVRAIVAGNDVLVFGPAVTAGELDQVYQDLVDRYRNDVDVQLNIDESAHRLLQLHQQQFNK